MNSTAPQSVVLPYATFTLNVCALHKAAIKDVDLTNEARDSIFVFGRGSSRCSFLHGLRNSAGRNSAGEDRDGAAHRRRTAWRLLYRPALFQTGLQVLGLCAKAGPALEHGPARDVKRKTKTRARSRAFKFRQRQQLCIQTLR